MSEIVQLHERHLQKNTCGLTAFHYGFEIASQRTDLRIRPLQLKKHLALRKKNKTSLSIRAIIAAPAFETIKGFVIRDGTV